MCKTYPLVIFGVSSIVALGIYTNHRYQYDNAEFFEIFFKIQASIGIALPLMLASYIYFSQQTVYKIISQIVFVALGFAYYFYLSQWIQYGNESFIITNIIVWIGSLSILFLSHWNRAKHQDNQLRFCDANIIWSTIIAWFFTGVLCLGIAGVFQSLEYLFDVAIQRDYMADITMIVMGIWWTSLFLKRITHHTTYHYPKLLEIFAKYILAILVGIYTLILLSYGIKILLTGIWPKGEVVYMVMWYFALGFATTLCLYPLTNTPNYRRVRNFNLWFYISSLPILFLGFMSLYLRVDQYGWTINRYLVVALLCFFACLWLFNILYKNYKTFWLFSLLSVFCVSILLPFVGFNDVIRNHQTHKLGQALLQANVLDTNNKLIGNIVLTGTNAQQVYSSIDYIGNTFDQKTILKLVHYSDKIQTTLSLTGNRYEQTEQLKNIFWLSEYNGSQYWYINRPSINRYTDQTFNTIDIVGYKKLTTINYYNGDKSDNAIINNNNTTETVITVDWKTYTIWFAWIFNQYGELFNNQNSGSPHTEVLSGKDYKAFITEFDAYKDQEWKINHYKIYLLTK